MTTSPASTVEPKKATSVRTASGFGTTRSQIFVATPSVPSEPTKAPQQVVARVVELGAAERDLGRRPAARARARVT